MSENTCTGSCSQCGGCNGCSEKVTLSNNSDISFVSNITFSSRNYENSKCIRLVMECKKPETVGECFAGIRFFKDKKCVFENNKAYSITNGNTKCLNLDFAPYAESDKAEVKVFCKNGATLFIEHINVINIP